MWKAHSQTLTLAAAAMTSRHVGCRPCLIDEQKPIGVEVKLVFKPGTSFAQDVRAILFDRVTSLFYV
jgi:hypothetical protein